MLKKIENSALTLQQISHYKSHTSTEICDINFKLRRPSHGILRAHRVNYSSFMAHQIDLAENSDVNRLHSFNHVVTEIKCMEFATEALLLTLI